MGKGETGGGGKTGFFVQVGVGEVGYGFLATLATAVLLQEGDVDGAGAFPKLKVFDRERAGPTEVRRRNCRWRVMQ